MLGMGGANEGVPAKETTDRTGKRVMAAATVRMTVGWSVPVGRSRSVTEALNSLMVAARAEPGFVYSSLSTEFGQNVGLKYIEEWASEAHLQRMLRSDHFSALAALMDEALGPPSVDFTLPGGSRGLEYVQESRFS